MMDIRVVHSYKRPHAENRCSGHMCSHLCLPSGQRSYSCLCPPSMTLKNNMTCEPNPKPIVPVTTAPIGVNTKSTHSSLAPHLVPFTTESTVEEMTKSLEEIELEKSHNKKKIDDYHHHKNRSRSGVDDSIFGGQTDGRMAVIITVILLIISLVIGTLTLFIYRKYQRFVSNK